MEKLAIMLYNISRGKNNEKMVDFFGYYIKHSFYVWL